MRFLSVLLLAGSLIAGPVHWSKSKHGGSYLVDKDGTIIGEVYKQSGVWKNSLDLEGRVTPSLDRFEHKIDAQLGLMDRIKALMFAQKLLEEMQNLPQTDEHKGDNKL